MGSALLILLVAQPSHASPSIERISGENRVDTAVATSQHAWESADSAVIATASDFPDALAAGSLAALENAPLLLTGPDELATTVAQELTRLGVEEVTIVGGTEAVSESVGRQIERLDASPVVHRVAGASRYETAQAVASSVGASDDAVVVSGEDFPDAISATALSIGPATTPVIFSHPTRLLEETDSALATIGARNITVIGGPAAINDDVVGDLEAEGRDVERLSGQNRYETSMAVAQRALELRGEDARTAVFASGASFADALGAGVLAARVEGVLMLASPDQPESALDGFLRERTDAWDDGYAIGGSAALGDAAVESIGRSVRGEEHPEPEPEPELVAESQETPGDVAVAEAREQLGKPYRYGANGPGSFDCSGLTSYVWRAAGVNIPRVSREQFSQLPSVSRSDARPGDIVAFGNPVHHVGIYIGDGQMIEASRSGIPVRTAPIDRSGFRGFVRPAE